MHNQYIEVSFQSEHNLCKHTFTIKQTILSIFGLIDEMSELRTNYYRPRTLLFIAKISLIEFLLKLMSNQLFIKVKNVP